MVSGKKVLLPLSAVVILLITGLIYFFKYQYIPSEDVIIFENSDSLQAEVEIPKLYEIPIDSFQIVEGRVKQNQTLGNLLRDYNLPEGSLAQLLSIPREDFDLRKIRVGNKYVLFLDNDSLNTLRYFVYEHTFVDYHKICFFDSVWAQKGQKEITVVKQKLQGKIQTSLWNAMIDAGANPMLANDLSDIYAWSIDFFGLQEGDSFSVVCDEQFVDTISIGYGKIHAAYFYHSNADFYAVPFTQGGIESYYDLEGNSLRKAFLKAPLKFSRISSHFSNSRMHPILKIRRPHHGVDYSAPSGTPVYAIGDGKIIKASYGYNKGGGNFIRIKHNGVYETAYLHLKAFAKGIEPGIYVKQGDLIAYVGTTGLSTGPHLDFRFYKNGQAIDPLKVKAPPVEPIADSNNVAFDSVKTLTLTLLGIRADSSKTVNYGLPEVSE
ncbi:MAG: peptidoglycan DD-metalloendopeptidase family protein [Bacteroidales bacterium]|nr:peptidoglycan DD-metalloendopeptidase family protein [Bacteroidales bacterium]